MVIEEGTGKGDIKIKDKDKRIVVG